MALSVPPCASRSACSSPSKFTPRAAIGPKTGVFHIALLAGRPPYSNSRAVPTLTESTLPAVVNIPFLLPCTPTLFVISLTIECILTGFCVSRKSAESIERRSEEHTSELQSQSNLVCRLLLEKKKKKQKYKHKLNIEI